MTTAISQCRICGNPNLLPLLDLGEMALTGIFPKRLDQIVETAPLELVQCSPSEPSACGLVQLKHSFEPAGMFGETYGYRSGLNRSMVEHLTAKAAQIREVVSPGPGDLVLDVGSNDGTLLRAMAAPGVTLTGMDPSGAKFLQYYPPDACLIPDFFSAVRFRREFGSRRAKVVTSIAMFYDLEAPFDFVRDVADILADDGVWVFEQSYLPSMLRTNSYDTICHEHLEYYALKQVLWMTQKADLKILDIRFNAINGGSFSVMAAKASAPYREDSELLHRVLAEEKAIGLDQAAVFAAFAERVQTHRRELPARLHQFRNQGLRVYGYGASTKGNVVLQYCGIAPDLLPCIAEVNEGKFGSFTPGTLIPIVSEAQARESAPDIFMVLPWHFRDNIFRKEQEYLRAGGKLMFPLPKIEITEYADSAHHRA